MAGQQAQNSNGWSTSSTYGRMAGEQAQHMAQQMAGEQAHFIWHNLAGESFHGIGWPETYGW